MEKKGKDLELLIKHAWQFYRHFDTIMSDIKLRSIPVYLRDDDAPAALGSLLALWQYRQDLLPKSEVVADPSQGNPKLTCPKGLICRMYDPRVSGTFRSKPSAVLATIVWANGKVTEEIVMMGPSYQFKENYMRIWHRFESHPLSGTLSGLIKQLNL